MRLLRAFTNPALEENSDGRVNKELEFVFYARLPRFEQLDHAAAMEFHEQWELDIPKVGENAVGGRVRIRKTVKKNLQMAEYVHTTKTKRKGGGDDEVSILTTEPHFMQYKYMSSGGMIKDRFTFPVEGSELIWEVDMFHKPGGGYWEWCKIDLEVKDKTQTVPPFPIDFQDIIVAQEGKRTEAEENKIRALYEYEFITKNQFLKAVA